MKPRFACLLLLVMTACAKEPFAPEPMPALINPDPRAMLESFTRAWPNRFTTDDTIIIHFPFHDDIAALGVVRVDRSAGIVEMVALTHVGIKLFDLRGDRSGVSIVFALPPLMAHQTIMLSVAHDIANMYLDLAPAQGAKTDIESNKIQFTDKHSGQTIIYDFGGSHSALLQKQQEGFFGAAWRVRYYQYSTDSGGLYPRGIVMDNGRYHYRIIVKNRDVEIDQ